MASGIQLFPRTYTTKRDRRGGAGKTMAARRVSVRQLAASPGSTMLVPGWTPISKSKLCKDKIGIP